MRLSERYLRFTVSEPGAGPSVYGSEIPGQGDDADRGGILHRYHDVVAFLFRYQEHVFCRAGLARLQKTPLNGAAGSVLSSETGSPSAAVAVTATLSSPIADDVPFVTLMSSTTAGPLISPGTLASASIDSILSIFSVTSLPNDAVSSKATVANVRGVSGATV